MRAWGRVAGGTRRWCTLVTRRRLLMDVRPLRVSPAFRRLWAGTVLSAVGAQMTFFGVTLQIWTLTHSSLAVGATGLVGAVSSVVLGLFAGSIVDAVDRRRVVLYVTAGQMAVSASLAAQAFAGLRSLWLLYALIGVQAALGAVNAPARRTFMPRLLSVELVPAGAALTVLAAHLSMAVGQPLAGLLAGAGGLRLCYLVDTVSFLAALYGVARLPAMPPASGTGRAGPAAVAEGLRFIRGNPVVLGALLTDASAMVLGAPFALFPALNAARFGGHAQTLGLLMAAPSIGGLIGSALSGPVGRVARPARAMLVAGAVWGGLLVCVGLSSNLAVTLALLVGAGIPDTLSVVFRTAMVQTATPDRYRGRTSAAEQIAGVGAPQLGNLRAGALAALASPTVAMVTGGVSTIGGAALIALMLPAYRRYRAVTPVLPLPAPAHPTDRNQEVSPTRPGAPDQPAARSATRD